MIYEFHGGRTGPASAERVAELIAAQRPPRPVSLADRIRCWLDRVATRFARLARRPRPSALPSGPRLHAGVRRWPRRTGPWPACAFTPAGRRSRPGAKT